MFLSHHVIIIPGLGNETEKLKWVLNSWNKYHLIPYVFDARWKIEENSFQPKLDEALKLVDSLVEKNTRISLIGNSAGSSFALNIFAQRKKLIHRVVINCGRVRRGDWPWFTFEQATKSSPSFKESVIRAEKIEKKLTNNDRKKIITFRPLFDEVVPPQTVTIQGAKNEIIPSIEHMCSIALSMTLLKKQIIEFIVN